MTLGIKYLLKKRPADKWHKDDVLTIAWWLREATAILLGILFAITGVTGLPAAVAGVALPVFGGLLWASKVGALTLATDPLELFADKLPPAVAAFLVTWIITHTVISG